MLILPDNILTRVNTTINKYQLFNQKDTVLVSYSGGKDSFLLCYVLKELGYNILPAIIDIGYNIDWSQACTNLKKIHLEASIVNSKFYEKDEYVYKEVNRYNNIISMISRDQNNKTTICTPCYNAKAIILKNWAEKNKINIITSGHHGTDALASLFKSFIMYVDRWENKHERFEYKNYLSAIIKLQKNFSLNNNAIIYDKIKDLIIRKVVGTDEPVKQYIKDSTILVARPLFDLYKNNINGFYQDTGITFQTPECFITGIRNSKVETPRELAQHIILDKMNLDTLDLFHSLVELCLDEEGFLLFNARNNRNTILGEYKSDKICDIKL